MVVCIAAAGAMWSWRRVRSDRCGASRPACIRLGRESRALEPSRVVRCARRHLVASELGRPRVSNDDGQAPRSPQMSKVKDIKLVTRAQFLTQCPAESDAIPEFAIFGRSNVGKSSLINFICERKLVASVSKRPGHTQFIHHYLMNHDWYLVDLPGVGYADLEGKKLKTMGRMVTAYVRHRTTMIQLLYLVDISVPPQDIDLEGIKFMVTSGVHLSIVFTKSDKAPEKPFCKPGVDAVENYRDTLWTMADSPFRLGLMQLPEMIVTSSRAGVGAEAVLKHIADLRKRCTSRIKVAQAAARLRAASETADVDGRAPADVGVASNGAVVPSGIR